MSNLAAQQAAEKEVAVAKAVSASAKGKAKAKGITCLCFLVFVDRSFASLLPGIVTIVTYCNLYRVGNTPQILPPRFTNL